LKELQCGQLLPHAIGSEEQLIVDSVKRFHLYEPHFLIIDELREISIIPLEIFYIDLLVSLQTII
jgi:hypothetical protein